MRHLLARISLVLFGVLLAFLVCELAFRLVLKMDLHLYVYDNTAGWTLKAGAKGWNWKEGHSWVQINSDAMRDHEHAIAKPPGTVRVAFLGDSFTEARQVDVDKTFSAVTQ